METLTLTHGTTPTDPVAQLDLGIEELDDMLAPDGWGDFMTGFGVGVALVGLGVAAT